MRKLPFEDGTADDHLEVPVSPYALALWNLIIRPPRRRYNLARLGPKEFKLWSCGVQRRDITLRNPRGMQLECSHFLPTLGPGETPEPRPVVIYLHANSSCRLEALPLVTMFLPLGISLFAFDFAGCGESEGEYISLGWYERDDLAECIDYLRKTELVSTIGLWGRSMGSVTALLHADRDHSIGGMVLDSAFASLRQLASELAQSDYKVPSWLLSGALAIGRMRIKSLCNFDIDALAPERHVSASFVPAFFIAARGDDFVAPHHTQRLYEAYNGDKELEMVDGDHNSPRIPEINRKVVLFFCRAFRLHSAPDRGTDMTLAKLLGFDAVSVDSSTDYPIVGRQLREDACRLLATVGGGRAWLGERQHVYMPFRIESALQLNQSETEAGFCVCLSPMPSDWGGMNRPPTVMFAYVTVRGVHISRATETAPELLSDTLMPEAVELNVPLLVVLELRPSAPHLRLQVGAEGGPEVAVTFDEEYYDEISVWPMTKKGEGVFFDWAIADSLDEESLAPAHPAGDRGGELKEGPQHLPAIPAGGIPTPVAAPPSSAEANEAPADSSLCRTQ